MWNGAKKLLNMIIDKLSSKNLIHPPKFLPHNTHYLVTMGSQAYGVATENSDNDIYGFCIPYKTDLFPHLQGYVEGFGTRPPKFEQWHEPHIFDPETNKEYDFTVYSVTKFFNLCMENNPNMVDALFVPRRCIIHASKIGEHVRANKKLFIHKGAYKKFRGYAFSQLSKMDNKKFINSPERAKEVETTGYSTKFAYHLVRLCLEIEQLMLTGDMQLDGNVAILRSIRNGEWTSERVHKWFEEKEPALEALSLTCSLPDRPREPEIKQVLLECLEMHYGTMSDAIKVERSYEELVNDLKTVLDRHNVSFSR